MYVHNTSEISPTLILVPIYLIKKIKKYKKKQTRALPVETLESLKFF
jgi:hypothetical protein